MSVRVWTNELLKGNIPAVFPSVMSLAGSTVKKETVYSGVNGSMPAGFTYIPKKDRR
jgi:hypothetical protein